MPRTAYDSERHQQWSDLSKSASNKQDKANSAQLEENFDQLLVNEDLDLPFLDTLETLKRQEDAQAQEDTSSAPDAADDYYNQPTTSASRDELDDAEQITDPNLIRKIAHHTIEAQAFINRTHKQDESLKRHVLLNLFRLVAEEDESLRRNLMYYLLTQKRCKSAANRAQDEPVLDREVQPGTLLASYRIEKLLGQGGMGEVYLASRQDLDHMQVAIKIMSPNCKNHDALRRFQQERQILANLKHPYIAQLYDGGTTEGGLPYLVMEYVEGEPIHQYCDSRRLNVRRRLTLFLKVCKALSFAHRNMVMHRDIKPSNILIDLCGEPKLLDLSMAPLM